ncbi:polysaccharide deacetylase family protein [Naumannella sp. ID2617S]|nr:polysaccharide deacetylase family protein [Naumannella sp. ID2617S]
MTRCLAPTGRLLLALALLLALFGPTRVAHAAPVTGAIGMKWEQVRGLVGEAEQPEFCGLVGGGCGQRFQRGFVYWSPASGAHPVTGAILGRWGVLGSERSFLGYPVTDEFCGLRDGGCGQHFQRGSIYWSPATGAWEVGGEILRTWIAHGWEAGASGYPTSQEFCGLRDRGCVQRFGNGAIYHSPFVGTHRVAGMIWEGYRSVGWENSPLSYPTEEEFCGLRDGGCVQRFQGGLVYWSPAGAYAVFGAIGLFYAETGWETGRFGYARSNERCRVEGGVTSCEQDFAGGRITWRSDRGISTGVDCRVQKCIALTYDDGPSAHTDRLLDTLSREGARATFFMVGTNVSGRPGTVRRMRDLGMEVANHTVNHPDLRTRSESQIRYEIGDTNRRIRDASGVNPTYFRPPYGATNATVNRVAAENGLAVINWNYDTWDWRDRNASVVAGRVLNEAGPNSVVLMHDLHATTVDAAPAIVRGLKDRGFTMVTVSELLGSGQPGRVYFTG